MLLGAVPDDGISGARWKRIEDALVEVERRTGFLARFTPDNWTEERGRLRAAWLAGHPSLPRFEYSEVPGLGDLQTALGGLRLHFPSDVWREFFEARTEELALEIALVQARGSRQLSELAARRFRVKHEFDEADFFPQVCSVSQASHEEPNVDLANFLQRVVEERRLPARVVQRDHLLSVAAAGDGVLAVRRGAMVTRREGERIARHEIEAHLLPRLASSTATQPLLRVGAAGCSEEEEGRALLIEERCGLLGQERRRELLVRHEAAQAVQKGADFVEVTRLGLGQGLELERALYLATRLTRGGAASGGGLAREGAYLPALVRVRRAFGEAPELERWFERGRATLHLARSGEPGL